MKIVIMSILLVCSAMTQAQDNKNISPTEAIKSIEGITDLMLDILSGPQGEARDWDLYKSLFAADANMNIVNSNAPSGKQIRTITIDDFVNKYSAAYSRDGFLEYSTEIKVHEFNGVATAFQYFYCKNLIGTYENRGVNTYQLVFAEDRWWITSLAFANETIENKVPEKYRAVKE